MHSLLWGLFCTLPLGAVGSLLPSVCLSLLQPFLYSSRAHAVNRRPPGTRMAQFHFHLLRCQVWARWLERPTWDCSMRFSSITPTTILQLRLSSKAEIPLLLSPYSCDTAKHILRHIFVLWEYSTDQGRMVPVALLMLNKAFHKSWLNFLRYIMPEILILVLSEIQGANKDWYLSCVST